MLKTTLEFKLKKKFFYILDFKNFLRPILLPVYFVNRNAAKRVLKANISNRLTIKRFSIIRGDQIKTEKIPYITGPGNYLSKGGKYLYPKDLYTKQERKSFRTLMRRRLRRMNILTNNKVRANYDKNVLKTKHKPNHQTVADCPRTDAKVFQLDRKPKKTYYILLKKGFTKRNGRLFKLRCIQLNAKTGEHKKVTILTFRNDIFIPWLLEELKKIPNAEGAIKAYQRYNKRKQEKVPG